MTSSVALTFASATASRSEQSASQTPSFESAVFVTMNVAERAGEAAKSKIINAIENFSNSIKDFNLQLALRPTSPIKFLVRGRKLSLMGTPLYFDRTEAGK